MKTVRSHRSVVEIAILTIVMILVMVDWSRAEITTRLAASEPPPSGGAPQADTVPAPQADSRTAPQADETAPASQADTAARQGDRIAKQTLTSDDKSFIDQALKGGTAEVQEAKLAHD